LNSTNESSAHTDGSEAFRARRTLGLFLCFFHGALELYNRTKTYCMPGLKKKVRVNVKLSRRMSSRHVYEWIYSSIHFCPWFQVGVPGRVGAPANLLPRKEPIYPLSERFDGPQSGSGRINRKMFLLLPGKKNHGFSIIQPPSRPCLFLSNAIYYTKT
jgi:hypothetical protein